MFTSIAEKSSPWVLFLVTWLYGQALFGIIIVTQSVFTKARAAAITTSIVYFGCTTVNYFVTDEDTPATARLWASLSPTVCMIQTISVLSKYEGSQVGITADTVWSEYQNYSVGRGITMQAINCIWLTLAGFYLEQVMPKTYGRRRAPWFCLQPSFWGCCKKRAKIGAVGIAGPSPRGVMPNQLSPEKPHTGFESVEQTFKFETKNMNPECYEKLGPEFDQKEI